MNTTAHVLVAQLQTPTVHHLLAMTTAVSMKLITPTPLMISCVMAWTAQLLFENAVTGAPGSVRTFLNQPLTILRSGCAVMRTGAMRMCTLNTLSSTSSDGCPSCETRCSVEWTSSVVDH